MIVRLDLAPGAVIREDDCRPRSASAARPFARRCSAWCATSSSPSSPAAACTSAASTSASWPCCTRPGRSSSRTRCGWPAPAAPADDWDEMAAVLEGAATALEHPDELLAIDRRCRELVWAAADNRFLTDTLDMLYAQSDRLWHLYLGDVADLHR